MNRSPILFLALVLVFLALPHASFAASSPVPLPYHQLVPEPRILVLTPGLDGGELADFLDRLEAKGIEVPVAVAGAGCIVIDSPEAGAVLASETTVASVHRNPIEDVAERARSPALAGLLLWWNRGFETPQPEAPPSMTYTEGEICTGAVTLEEAIRARGIHSRCSAPPGSGRVHFASGKAVVNLIYPESSGSASIENWTMGQMDQVEAELVRALAWWNLKAGGALTFVLVNRGQVDTPYEPGNMLMSDEELYLAGCMQSLGYDGDCAYTELDQFNEAARAQYRGNWAFTQVVLHANEFIGSQALAYAYLGGPHTVALYGNRQLGTGKLDRVMAHEIGHIFQALDEYAGGCGGCTERSGYLDERNGNCVICPLEVGKCVMRSASEYGEQEMEEMETRIHPCIFTLGQVGLRDANQNGILDVRETIPETVLNTDLPDTVFATRNVKLQGKAWDMPYALAPPKYSNPVTLNLLANVIFSIDGRSWLSAHPLDGLWSEQEEDYEISLPEVGGGSHRLYVRGVNSISKEDPSPVRVDFFVYDVILHGDISAAQEKASLVVKWRINGEDFGSTYTLLRHTEGTADEVVAVLQSRHTLSPRYTFLDDNIEPAREYYYTLEVDIPGKGRKALGSARGKTYLASPPPGHIVTLSPNPTAGTILITVTVPRGIRNGGVGPPPDDGGGDHIPLSPWLRDDDDPPPGPIDGALLWREVHLSLYDVAGRRVRDLGTTRQLELTRFNVWWDGTNEKGARVPPGIYFLSTEIGETLETTRVTIVH